MSETYDSETYDERIEVETHLGVGEVEKIKSPLGVPGTTWLVSLPWTSYVFFGGMKALLQDISRIDVREESKSNE